MRQRNWLHLCLTSSQSQNSQSQNLVLVLMTTVVNNIENEVIMRILLSTNHVAYLVELFELYSTVYYVFFFGENRRKASFLAFKQPEGREAGVLGGQWWCRRHAPTGPSNPLQAEVPGMPGSKVTQNGLLSPFEPRFRPFRRYMAQKATFAPLDPQDPNIHFPTHSKRRHSAPQTARPTTL